MTISIAAVTPGFAAEIGDVDLSQPLNPEEVEAIKQAFWHYAVLIFPEQKLTEQQHLAFAQYIGPLETNLATFNKNATLRLTPHLVDISNLTVKNEIWGGAESDAPVSTGQPAVAYR
jgi:alpha-ketoglutarate-dependent 2,4-dichlorophenoxyacetate dioxygenase